MKFEDNWTSVRLRTDTVPWLWDSQIAAHQIDNREGITSLKFQTYVHFGIIDYDSEINPILKADSANGMNKLQSYIDSSPEHARKVLEYCALDSVYEYRLAMMQMNILGYDMLPF